jgi:hypothetical protein
LELSKEEENFNESFFMKIMISVFQKKEALKEEKLLRKEEEKRRYSGNNDFLVCFSIISVEVKYMSIKYKLIISKLTNH